MGPYCAPGWSHKAEASWCFNLNDRFYRSVQTPTKGLLRHARRFCRCSCYWVAGEAAGAALAEIGTIFAPVSFSSR